MTSNIDTDVEMNNDDEISEADADAAIGFAGRRRPLKLGIHLDIIAVLGEEIDRKRLAVALNSMSLTSTICGRRALAAIGSISTAIRPEPSLRTRPSRQSTAK